MVCGLVSHDFFPSPVRFSSSGQSGCGKNAQQVGTVFIWAFLLFDSVQFFLQRGFNKFQPLEALGCGGNSWLFLIRDESSDRPLLGILDSGIRDSLVRGMRNTVEGIPESN